ncbi:unnamed protein product [Pedinophyceae sp. YPF-701]|nr:unnamed protein product [Pedinophyceae sp. YPF-701]
MTYSFPLLDAKEILGCLAELDINLSPENLEKPSYETLKPMYEQLVMLLVGVTREELQQPVFAAIDAFEFPELHDESIPVMAFGRALQKLMFAAGAHDFSLKDVYKATRERTVRNLSAIINFGKYREERLQTFQAFQEEADARAAQRQALVDEGDALRAEIARLEQARADEKPRAAAVRAEVEGDVLPRLQGLFAEKDGLVEELKRVRGTANELASRASQLKLDLAEEGRREDRLRGMVVQSPERMQKAITEREFQLERERQGVAAAERALVDATNRREAVGRAMREAEGAVKAMEELEVGIAKKKEVSGRVKDLRANIEAADARVLELQASIQHLGRQKASAAERLQRLEAQYKMKQAAAAATLEQQLCEKEAIEAANAAKHARIADNDAQVRAAREQARALEEAHGAAKRELVTQYRALRAQLGRYVALNREAMGAGVEGAEAMAAEAALAVATPAPRRGQLGGF